MFFNQIHYINISFLTKVILKEAWCNTTVLSSSVPFFISAMQRFLNHGMTWQKQSLSVPVIWWLSLSSARRVSSPLTSCCLPDLQTWFFFLSSLYIWLCIWSICGTLKQNEYNLFQIIMFINFYVCEVLRFKCQYWSRLNWMLGYDAPTVNFNLTKHQVFVSRRGMLFLVFPELFTFTDCDSSWFYRYYLMGWFKLFKCVTDN